MTTAAASTNEIKQPKGPPDSGGPFPFSGYLGQALHTVKAGKEVGRLKVRVEIRDPNPPAVTARLLVQALMEVNWAKVEQALREERP